MTMDLFTLFLLRHGESEGNVRRIYQGQADFPLTERGRAQARALAAHWQAQGQRFDAILASPLSRARETAEIIAAAFDLPVELEPLLMERDNGSRQGRRPSDPDWVPVEDIPPSPYRTAFPAGESDWQLYLRAGQMLHKVMQRPPGRYLLVSHGGFLNQLVHAILGLTPRGLSGPRFRFSNTGFYVFTYAPDEHTWHMHASNLAHLKGGQNG